MRARAPPLQMATSAWIAESALGRDFAWFQPESGDGPAGGDDDDELDFRRAHAHSTPSEQGTCYVITTSQDTDWLK